MSQWGNLDRLILSGTASANSSSTTSTTVVATLATTFASANVMPGDSLLLDNVAYRVASTNGGNTAVLDVAFTGANSTSIVMGVQESPKDILTYGWATSVGSTPGANGVTKRNVFGVDSVEVSVAANKLKGFNHPGWAYHETYTNSQGTTRYRTETLVAMSKNFNRDPDGNLLTDAADDSVLADS